MFWISRISFSLHISTILIKRIRCVQEDIADWNEKVRNPTINFQFRPHKKLSEIPLVELKSLEITKYKGFIDKKNSQGLGSRQGRNKVERFWKDHPPVQGWLKSMTNPPILLELVTEKRLVVVTGELSRIGVIIGPGSTTFTSLPFFGLVFHSSTTWAIKQQR